MTTSHWFVDIESRGKLAFNKGILKNHKEAESFARRIYRSCLERDCFLAGWNMAFWGSKRT